MTLKENVQQIDERIDSLFHKLMRQQQEELTRLRDKHIQQLEKHKTRIQPLRKRTSKFNAECLAIVEKMNDIEHNAGTTLIMQGYKQVAVEESHIVIENPQD